MRFFIGFILLFGVISCSENTHRIDVHSAIKSQVDSLISKSEFNGVIQLQKNGQTIYQKCKGYSNIEGNVPLLLDDQFVIGSISKQITAVLVLQFYETQKLNLSDTIGMYLKGIHQDWKNQITIHQLLTHTHGILDVTEELAFPPGSQFQYSQLGYHLLAKILENISNQSFEELTTELFLKSNLDNTFHPDSEKYNLVIGYEANGGELVKMTNSMENYAAAGSIVSTSGDLLRWNELLYNGKLLKNETFELMKTRYATRMHPIYGELEYGYGLLFEKNQSHIQIGALGYAPGFVSSCHYFPQSKYNLVVLENVAQDIPDFAKCFKTQLQLLELIKALK